MADKLGWSGGKRGEDTGHPADDCAGGGSWGFTRLG